jgi:SAM-dependent methyltransferase
LSDIEVFSIKNSCRHCLGIFFKEDLKLKPSPLANELFQEKQDSIMADTFPLNVKMCTVCHSYQLDCIVKADRLFSSYSYSSGLSSSLLKSFEATLQEIQHHLSDGKGVIEIGSNDGSLLGLIKKAGIQAVGVEPSLRHVNETLNRGMSVVHGYCDSVGLSRARELLGLEVGAVVGNNVFAHIDDLIGSFKQISSILADQGYLIFEVSYFPDVVRLGLFDTIYHEHMSYHTVNSLKRLLEMAGMMLVKITHITTHGGSIRVVAQKGKPKKVSR